MQPVQRMSGQLVGTTTHERAEVLKERVEPRSALIVEVKCERRCVQRLKGTTIDVQQLTMVLERHVMGRDEGMHRAGHR